MKKRILFIAQRYPYPLISGDRLRAYNFLELLSKTYDVDFLVLEDPKGHDSAMELSFVSRMIHIPVPLVSRAFSFLQSVCRGLPLQVALYSYAPVRRYVKEHAAEYDYVFCHLVRTAEYARDIVGKKILDYSDSYSLLYAPHQRPKGFWGFLSFLEYSRIRRYEGECAAFFDTCLAVSVRDKKWLGESCGVPEEKIVVVPNGVPDGLLTMEREEPEVPTLIFSGNMSYYPNVDAIHHFVRAVFPAIKKEITTLRLMIVGANPARSVMALKSHDILVTGTIDNISEYLTKSTIAIAPLRFASGVQNKVLEAMALGLPVVTTHVVAEGIEGVTHEHLMVAESDEDMIDAILELLEDRGRRLQLGRNARNFIKATYRWEDSEKKLTKSINELDSTDGNLKGNNM